MEDIKRTELQETLHKRGESPLKKYARLVLGKSGLWNLIRYELRILLFGNIPGALGILMRRTFYRCMFKEMGTNVILGRGLTIRHPSKISLGNNVAIDDLCVLDARGGDSSELVIGNNSTIARNTILRTKDGSIRLSPGCSIGANCILSSSSTLTAGDNLLMASCTYVIAGGQHTFERTDIPIISQGMESKGGVSIGKNVWVGARVTILDGTRIGDNAVIGACSLVNKDIPDYAVAYGIPAKPVKDRRKTG
jgi:acetyltransferase-like isoleucine patch superfamily enzyme